ncbi:MAG: hypothetical protein K2X35_17415 [Bryobacteraceae bacterium]|nr:hypothetical protein [Bryobacteraceae bacterium]
MKRRSLVLAPLMAAAQQPSAVERIRGLKPEEGRKLTQAAAEIEKQARSQVEELVKLAQSAETREQARMVLSELGELAAGSLLKSIASAPVEYRKWALTEALEGELRFRARVAAALDPLFDARDQAPGRRGRERSGAASRICDELYVAAVRFADQATELDEHFARMERFRQLPEGLKDVEIRRFRQSKAWRRLVEEGRTQEKA